MSDNGIPAKDVSVSLDPEWDRLVSCAEAMLDEEGEVAWERRKAAAERIRERMVRRGQSLKIDVLGVRRALVAYWGDVLAGKCDKGFRKVFSENKVPCSDFLDGREVYPEFRLVLEYIQGRMKELARISASEMAQMAQASQQRLVTEEDCGLNQRAVELSLRATLGEVYGDREERRGKAGDDKRSITYNFPNLTMNWIVPPSEIPKVGVKPEPEVIDV